MKNQKHPNNPDEYNYYLEALRFLKEWSTAIVVVESAVLAVLGGMLKDANIVEGNRTLFALGLFSIIISIFFCANVIGAIPPITQFLPENVKKHKDIYKMRNYAGVPLWILAFFQHIFALSGIVFITLVIFNLATDPMLNQKEIAVNHVLQSDHPQPSASGDR